MKYCFIFIDDPIPHLGPKRLARFHEILDKICDKDSNQNSNKKKKVISYFVSFRFT